MSAENYALVQENIQRFARGCGRQASDITLIAVSKTYEADIIRPVLEVGQRVFGENYVQEAKAKWPGLRALYPDVRLHLIGPLQSNKAKDAVSLFDAIHTLDRPSLAEALAKEMEKQNRRPILFVQVNTGDEPQKGGVSLKNLSTFLESCRTQWSLDIAGLMAIPPFDAPPSPHFALLKRLGHEHSLPFLSMGMSGDYAQAIQLGATHIRVGSAIFGKRS